MGTNRKEPPTPARPVTSFYSDEELQELGLGSVGRGVLLSRHAQLYSSATIHLGDHTRVDDFCILSGNIRVGRYCHVAAGGYMFSGGAKIALGDYVVLSSRVTIYAASDDFLGDSLMLNPSIRTPLRKTIEKDVILESFASIGTNALLLPGATLAEGTVLGAMSLLKKTTEPWSVYAGTPAVLVKPRSRKMKSLAQQFENA